MANITLKNIPDSLIEKLRKKAKANERSINSEILFMLKHYLVAENRPDAEEVIKRAQRFRVKVKGSLSADEIEKSINEGRP
ncbi:MAG TPA: Arc family DNA-binding protein [Cyclobacteriaceae bacterium]|nr:Arc family DNA-binding protein [Cyclobacteriaceae bacterium]